MATVHVTIPRMLADLVRSERRFDVAAETIDEVLTAVALTHPELGVHLRNETGAVREHVSLFHNDRVARDLHVPVAEGDAVVILQAVSGG
jgi:molybdopterin converting factor small subunit